MSTHPEDPRRPDPEQHDPHSGTPEQPPATPESQEPVVQGGGGSIDESDSAIELGLPAGSADILSDSDLHPPIESGISSGIAWAALMEEVPQPPADEVRIDSPSDADLLTQPPARPAIPEATIIAPPAELSSFPPHRPGTHLPPPPKPAPPGEPTSSDIFTADPTGKLPRPDTGVGGSSVLPADPTPSGDAARVDLGALDSQAQAKSGVESSIIDLGAVDLPADVSPSGIVEEVELVAENSGIDLSGEPSSGTGSGRDLIAEALESGIKFGPPPEPSDTGAAAGPNESVIDFGHPASAPEAPQVPAASPFSSALEFGGPAKAPPSSPFSSAIEFGGPSQPPANSPFSSAIEFGGPGGGSPTVQDTPPKMPPPTGSAISSAVDYGGGAEVPFDSSSSIDLVAGGDDSGDKRPTPPTGRPPTMVPIDRPPTMASTDRPPTMAGTGRPPTLDASFGRPPTLPATPEEMEAQIHAAGLGPTDSEVDLGSRPSSSDFEPLEGMPDSAIKTGSDSDIDINIGELPEGAGPAGSGLFVNANSGRLEPTEAAIDLDQDEMTEDATAEEPALAEAPPRPEKKAPSRRLPVQLSGQRGAWLGGGGIGVIAGAAAVYLLQLMFGGSAAAPKNPPPVIQVPPPPPEVQAYAQLQDRLRAGGFLDAAAGGDALKAVDDLVAKSKEGVAAKAQAAALAKERDDALAGGKAAKAEAEAMAAKAETAAKEGQAAKAQAAALAKERDDALAGGKAAKAEAEAMAAKAEMAGAGLKAAEERAKAGEKELAAAKSREAALTAGKAEAEGELRKVANELVQAKLLDPKAGKGGLVAAVQSAAKSATATDKGQLIRELTGEVNDLRKQLAQSSRPADMLAYWPALLREDSRPEVAAKAEADAARVAEDPKASPADKARATAVRGLALRNAGKFAEAKATLESAKAGLAAGDTEWRDRIDAALRDVADPPAYLTARAAELTGRGNTTAALAQLEWAESAYPAAKGRFLAERGLTHLEAARAKSAGPIPEADPELQAARKDIAEAVKTGDAKAFYAAGRLAEETGDLESAIADYRKAADLATGAAKSRYQLALARALMKSAPSPAEAPKPAADARPASPAGAALAALTVLLQGPASAGQSEAIELADKVLQSKDSTPEDKARALAIKGLYTQALLDYIDALRPSLKREQVEALKEIVQSHPALRRPESQAIASPQEAERHYSTGLRLLYSGQNAAAEKEFLAAVAADGQDARYFYFLGLSRLNQGKRDAYEDFEQGARLEQQGLPPHDAVNSALERVQGQSRAAIDNARGIPR